MKIAIFTDTFLPQINGVTNTLKRLGDYLNDQNIPYIFITPENSQQEEPYPYQMASFFSTSLLFYPECRFTIPNKSKLYKTLDDFKPDVLFLMTEFTVGMSGLSYGKKRGLPVISNYSTNFHTIIKSYKLGLLEKPLLRYLSWFHNEANLTVTPSEASKSQLHRLGVHHTAIFKRGIDTDMYVPENRDGAKMIEMGINSKIRLHYVGRLSPEKDLDILAKAMHILNQKYKNHIHLMLTGDGPMKERLVEIMPDNISFTGYQTGEDLARLYASAHIFSFPSSFETFGNVVLEAMASGVPVVGVNEGGVKNIIRHGETGYLADSFNPDSLAHYIEMLILSPAKRRDMGSAARDYALTQSWHQVFSDLMALFEKTCLPNPGQIKVIS